MFIVKSPLPAWSALLHLPHFLVSAGTDFVLSKLHTLSYSSIGATETALSVHRVIAAQESSHLVSVHLRSVCFLFPLLSEENKLYFCYGFLHLCPFSTTQHDSSPVVWGFCTICKCFRGHSLKKKKDSGIKLQPNKQWSWWALTTICSALIWNPIGNFTLWTSLWSGHKKRWTWHFKKRFWQSQSFQHQTSNAGLDLVQVALNLRLATNMNTKRDLSKDYKEA